MPVCVCVEHTAGRVPALASVWRRMHYFSERKKGAPVMTSTRNREGGEGERPFCCSTVVSSAISTQTLTETGPAGAHIRAFVLYIHTSTKGLERARQLVSRVDRWWPNPASLIIVVIVVTPRLALLHQFQQVRRGHRLK